MFTFMVTVADGDDFDAPTFTSTVSVDADNAMTARLIAEQMATIPQPGKPGHMQIVDTKEVCA